MDGKRVFKLPKAVKITGRSSSITNSFVNGIIPVVIPTQEDIASVLDALGMTDDTIACAYCGDKHSEWDHFRPIVKDKKPTGYISEINNLVPACGKRNQSKGNKDWRAWISSSAALSPKSREVYRLENKIRMLGRFEAWSNPTIIDFEELVGKQEWNRYWRHLEIVQKTMKEAQIVANDIRLLIQERARTS
ncbi:MAG: HNH endonuclease [Rhodobacteraceae bacterium]|nr:HNH endonuclease [Paracoccaceae bacterium]